MADTSAEPKSSASPENAVDPVNQRIVDDGNTSGPAPSAGPVDAGQNQGADGVTDGNLNPGGQPASDAIKADPQGYLDHPPSDAGPTSEPDSRPDQGAPATDAQMDRANAQTLVDFNKDLDRARANQDTAFEQATLENIAKVPANDAIKADPQGYLDHPPSDDHPPNVAASPEDIPDEDTAPYGAPIYRLWGRARDQVARDPTVAATDPTSVHFAQKEAQSPAGSYWSPDEAGAWPAGTPLPRDLIPSVRTDDPAQWPVIGPAAIHEGKALPPSTIPEFETTYFPADQAVPPATPIQPQVWQQKPPNSDDWDTGGNPADPNTVFRRGGDDEAVVPGGLDISKGFGVTRMIRPADPQDPGDVGWWK
jgi:hypothetical protein